MKLHFEPDLGYQRLAVDAVCDLFRGQETCRTEFTVVRDPTDPQLRMGFAESDLGVGNRLTLLDDELLKTVAMLAADEPLPRRYHDHPLAGEWKDHRDCHIKPDLVLIYRKPDAESLDLVRLGSHSELGL